VKLFCPRRLKRASIVAYLALGRIILVAMRPILSSLYSTRRVTPHPRYSSYSVALAKQLDSTVLAPFART